jgi:hypothetical protein
MAFFTVSFIVNLIVYIHYFSIFVKQICKIIAPNVPAVYDVFAAAIKETVGFQQPQKCGGEKPHKGA